MHVAVGGGIDQTEQALPNGLLVFRVLLVIMGKPVVCSVLRADVNGALRRQLAALKNIVKLSPVILVEKNIVPHQGKAIGFGVERPSEGRERSLLTL